MNKKKTKKARKIAKPVVKKAARKRTKKDVSPKEGTYLDLQYESLCELSCIYFAEELIKRGYAVKIERSPTYLLCDSVSNTYSEQLKKGSKTFTQTISQGVSYTPDFDIYFTQKALGLFCWELGSNVKWDKNLLVVQRVFNKFTGGDDLYRATCEVKPDFSRNSTTPKSVQSMKWLYQGNKVFVNLFRPNRIFEGLFVPDKYRITERGTQRLLKFKSKTLQEYLTFKNIK